MSAADEHIPKSKSGGSGKKRITEWDEHVQNCKERALFWHSLWKCNNSPRHGLLADIRRSTRAQYHAAIRALKRQNEAARANKLANSLSSRDVTSFWRHVRRQRECKSTLPNVVDGAHGANAIAETFAGNYTNLYNSVSFNVHEMEKLKTELESGIKSTCCAGKCKSVHSVSPVDVASAIKKLKHGKGDGNTCQTSDHFIHGTKKLNVYLALLLTSMLKHGQCSESMLLSTLVPIPKDKRKSLNTTDNYRAIAMGSIVGKIFDSVLLEQNSELFQTSDLQFGYKQDHSTTQCTFVAMETVNYYLQGGSNVYSVLLDASKAFDRVEYVKLFKLLIRKGACPLLSRLLVQSYIMQKLCVKWEGCVTESFSVTNGVKQGGVLSPVLFAVYMDELLLRLRGAGVGCRIGHTFVGALCYADDLQLLAPTRHALKAMLLICEQYSSEYMVKFNAGKSRLLVFGDDNPGCLTFMLNGKIIPRVKSEKHLGNWFGPGLSDDHFKAAISDMNWRTNDMLATFGNCNYSIKYKLFKSFCTAVYGSQLWDFSDSKVECVFTAWRKCVRRVINVPYTTHCVLLPLLCDDIGFEAQIHKRFLSFFEKAVNSSNHCVRLCANLVLNGSRSAACRSLNYVCEKYGVRKHVIATSGRQSFVPNFQSTLNMYNDVDMCKAGAIRDLLDLRECKYGNSNDLKCVELYFILR